MPSYMHTHTFVHTCSHTHTQHVFIHMHIQMCVHTCSHTCTYIHTHVHTHHLKMQAAFSSDMAVLETLLVPFSSDSKWDEMVTLDSVPPTASKILFLRSIEKAQGPSSVPHAPWVLNAQQCPQDETACLNNMLHIRWPSSAGLPALYPAASHYRRKLIL